jgi:hypothetical protein
MSRKEKLKEDLKHCTGQFLWRDLCAVLKMVGYESAKSGKTGGSRRRFYNEALDDVIFLHAPHGNEGKHAKDYQVKEVKKKLSEKGLL